jgi:diguanylate cyclase (GGDEF)-like protein
MKVLIVEDNQMYAKLIKTNLEKKLIFLKCDIISSFEELKNRLDYDLYIVDYVLPDTKEDEHIKFLISNNKKVIVITQFEEIFSKSEVKQKVVDYIIKEDVSVLNYLVNLVKRIYKNRDLTVLVAEDSTSVRNYEKFILELLNLRVIEAKDGKEALNRLKEEKVDFIITDLEMPNIDGLNLIKEVRQNYDMDKLPILVVSGEESMYKTIKVLKLGANDFIKKPFLKEEFTIRVKNILDMYDYLIEYKKEAFIDGLTEVYNRKFLETELEKLFRLYDKKTIAMLDIDFFKKINDTYGHQIGDEVLKHFANTIKKVIRRSDIIIRYGGEEFLIFMPNTNKKEAMIVLLKIKKALTPVNNIDYTFSAGVADEGENLIEMIKTADERLYKAKKTGRNKVVIE